MQNTLTEIQTKIDSMNQEMTIVRKKYQAKMKEMFKEIFSTYFQQCPEVTTFAWRQYTPYFNDGEECVFTCRANRGFATNALDYTNCRYGGYDGESDEETIWVVDKDYGNFNEELISKRTLNSTNKLRGILGKIEDSFYEEIFGNHCIVYATKDGFEVVDYEHD